MPGALENRLRKRDRHLSRWAAREPTDAYRLFDRDLPGYHFAVDRYGEWVVVHEYPWRPDDPLHESRRQELLEAVPAALGVPTGRIVVETHARQRPLLGRPRATPSAPPPRPKESPRQTVAHEHGLAFEIDLDSHLDVGLFLDHRQTRALVRSLAKGRRVLNLFCYSGAFTVHAAAGGARESVSVDLSQRYLDWTRRNLELNRLASPRHALVRGDVLEVLERGLSRGSFGPFDLVVLDPPPRSTSKRGRAFELPLDQGRFLAPAARLLAPGGVLFFSTSAPGFQLDPGPLASCRILELTALPPDFEGKRARRCWRIERP